MRVPKLVRDDDGRHIVLKSLPKAKQNLIRRHVRLHNDIIDYMNHYDDTSQELVKRLLIVTDLDPEMTKILEEGFELPVTGDHNQLFENYRETYYSRRCMSYFDDLYLCFEGACQTDDVEMLDRILGVHGSQDVDKRVLVIRRSPQSSVPVDDDALAKTARYGSFAVLRRLIDACQDSYNAKEWKRIYIWLLEITMRFTDTDIVDFLLARVDISSTTKDILITETVGFDNVVMLTYVLDRFEVGKQDVVNLMSESVKQCANQVAKYLIERTGASHKVILLFTTYKDNLEMVKYIDDNYNVKESTWNELLNDVGKDHAYNIAVYILERKFSGKPNNLLRGAVDSENGESLTLVKLAIKYGADNFLEAARTAWNYGRYAILNYLKRKFNISLAELA